jgi:hypothetical protein
MRKSKNTHKYGVRKHRTFGNSYNKQLTVFGKTGCKADGFNLIPRLHSN